MLDRNRKWCGVAARREPHLARLRNALLRVLPMLALFLPCVYRADEQKTSTEGLVKPPVIDKRDIRFISLSVGGEKLKRWVHGIVQDDQGFIWFATDDGLYKYDGYTLTPYLHDPRVANGISSGNLRTVYKDRSGNLWIGNVGEGLDRLDPARGTITHYRHQPGVESSLGDNSVRCIYQDRGETLWFGTANGLDRLDSSTGVFVHYRHNPRDPTSLTNDSVIARISKQNPALGSTLSQYAQRYAFSSIRQALQSPEGVQTGKRRFPLNSL